MSPIFGSGGSVSPDDDLSLSRFRKTPRSDRELVMILCEQNRQSEIINDQTVSGVIWSVGACLSQRPLEMNRLCCGHLTEPQRL